MSPRCEKPGCLLFSATGDVLCGVHGGKSVYPECKADGCGNRVPKSAAKYCSRSCFERTWKEKAAADKRANKPQCLADGCENNVARHNNKYCSQACSNKHRKDAEKLAVIREPTRRNGPRGEGQEREKKRETRQKKIPAAISHTDILAAGWKPAGIEDHRRWM